MVRRPMCVRAGLVVGTVLLSMTGPLAAEERLLLSFEKEESLDHAAWTEDKGDLLVVRYNRYGSYHSIRQGSATHGEWALSWTSKNAFDPAARYATESALAAVQRAGRVLNGSRWMAGRGLCGDWSDYDRLRVDVRATAPVRLRMRVADWETVPLPERVMDVPAGDWFTLEFDLAAAADPSRVDRTRLTDGQEWFFRCQEGALYRASPLDRTNIHGVYINVLKAEAGAELLVDNLRLVRNGAKVATKHWTITDPGPWPAPEALPRQTRPVAPNRRRVVGTPHDAQPVLIDVSELPGTSYGRMHNDRCGIAVADENNMAINFAMGMNRAVLVTADGGRTWRGLDGGDRPTTLFSGSLMMVGACCTPGDDGPDLLLVTLLHCSGGEEPSWVWFSRVRFAGGLWKTEPPRVMDVDSWHCPEHTMDVLRLPSGRLWGAWSAATRSGGITARYSDDDGTTWRSLRGLIGKGPHGEKRPLLVPYGDGVACFFGASWQPMFSWATTAGDDWSETTQPVPGLKGRPITGAKIADRELLVVVAGEAGSKDTLLHLADGKWSPETGAPFVPTRLAVSGGRLVAFRIEGGGIIAAVRDAAGKWGSVRELAAGPEAGPEAIADLAVPRQAPDHFVPVAWTPKSGKWIKFMRVPVEPAEP